MVDVVVVVMVVDVTGVVVVVVVAGLSMGMHFGGPPLCFHCVSLRHLVEREPTRR